MKVDMRVVDRVWLSPQARFMLAPGITVADQGLVDDDGRSFPLDPTGRFICLLADRPIQIAELSTILAARLGRDSGDMREDLLSFVSQLSGQGLVSVTQPAVAEFLAWISYTPILIMAQRSLRSMTVSRFPVRYHPPRLEGLLRACVEGHRVLLMSGPVLAVVLAVMMPPDLVPTLNALKPSTRFAVPVMVLAYALLWFAIATAHELGHFIAAKAISAPIIASYSRNQAAGIVLRPQAARNHIAVLLAGPLVGVVTVATAGAATWNLIDAWIWIRVGMDQLQLSWYSALLIVGASQLVHLTPICHDGRALRQQLRRRRLTSKGVDCG